MKQTSESGARDLAHSRIVLRVVIGVAFVLSRMSPRCIRAVLRIARRGARPADLATATKARDSVVAISTLCAGRYCLVRSIAAALVCRTAGQWPTWCSGVRTPPFAAHAWIEAEGQRVGEDADAYTYQVMISVPCSISARQAPQAGAS